MVFDEEGRALTLFESMAEPVEGLPHLLRPDAVAGAAEAYARTVTERLAAARDEDKARERERVRAMHKERKRKRKEQLGHVHKGELRCARAGTAHG